MRGRPAILPPLLVLPLLLLFVVSGPWTGAAASPAQDVQRVGDDDPGAVALLRQAQRAAADLTWTGTEYLTAQGIGGSIARVADVRHISGQGTVARVHGGGESTGAAVVAAFAPDPAAGAPAANPGSADRLLDTYTIRLLGSAEVGGRDAWALGVRRPDGSTAARLWVDRRSGLPLARERYDRTGTLAGSSVLLGVRVLADWAAVRAFAGHLPMADPVPLGSVRVSEKAASAAGFTVPDRLADGLLLVDAATMPDGVLRLTYSDGLSVLSLFQQRGRLMAGALPGTTQRRLFGATVHVGGGYPVRLTWEGDGTVFTLVGEAADDVLGAAVRSLPHGGPPPEPADGLADRLQRGVGRLTSWLNPFD